MKWIWILLFALSCHGNKPLADDDHQSATDLLGDRVKLYCELSESQYIGGAIEPNCDAALFTALHGLSCGYVSIGQFESKDEPGKLCRRPGCTCYDNWEEGTPGSDSGFSKDMALGVQLYLANKPNKKLVKRVYDYGKTNNWKVCDADSAIISASKCVMSSKIISRWLKLAAGSSLRGDNEAPSEGDLSLAQLGYEGHLQLIGILGEYSIYGGVSNSSKKVISELSAREKNNLLYQAASAVFVGKPSRLEVAKRALEFFPADRLPGAKDYCTPYLYQRDEYVEGVKNPDWLPCKGKTHPGTDFTMVAWILGL